MSTQYDRTASIPVPGVKPMDIARNTPPRSYGNTSELRERFRSLFGDMPMIREMDAYAEMSDTHQTLPFYKINRSAYLEEKFKGLVSRSGGWMERILPWAESDDIHFQWNEYTFNHTLIGRVPHQGNPRMVSYKRKAHNESSVRRGIGFVMEAGELLTTEGVRQYQINIQGISACIIETVFLNSIYSLLDAADRRERRAATNGIAQETIEDDFAREIEDYASIAARMHAFTETVHRKKALLDDATVALITSPESGIYMSQVTAKYTDTVPNYLTQGPEAIMSKPVSLGDFVIPMAGNGSLEVYTCRDLKNGEEGNFVRPLLNCPWIAEYNAHRGAEFRNVKFFDGFNDSHCHPCFSTDMRTIEVYSGRQDAMVPLTFQKAIQHTIFAHEAHLKQMLLTTEESDHPFKESDFLPFDLSKAMTVFDDILRPADSFPEIDMSTFKRGAPPTLWWNSKANSNVGAAEIAEYFGQWDPTALGPRTICNVAASISAQGNWTNPHHVLSSWNAMIEMMIHTDKEPFNKAFIVKVISYNMENANPGDAGAEVVESPEGHHVLGVGTQKTGILRLPPRDEGVDPYYPSGFGGFALLQAAALEYKRGTGWDHIAEPAYHGLIIIKRLHDLIKSTLYSEDISERNKPVNINATGIDAEVAALVQNLVYTDRAPVYVRGDDDYAALVSGRASGDRSEVVSPNTATIVDIRAGLLTESIGTAASEYNMGSSSIASAMRSATGSAGGWRVRGERIGSILPVVGLGDTTQVPLLYNLGEDARAIQGLGSRGAKLGFVTAVGLVRSNRDTLVSVGMLAPEEVNIEPILSEFAAAAADYDPTDKKEHLFAGTGAVIKSNFENEAYSPKQAFVESVALISGLNDRLTQRNKRARLNPDFKTLISKGKSFIDQHADGGTFSLFSLGVEHSPREKTGKGSTTSGVSATSISSSLKRVSERHSVLENARALDRVINATTAGVAYSMAQYKDGAHADALLMYNPSERSYNIALHRDMLNTIAISDNVDTLLENNATAALYNYAGSDVTLQNAHTEVVEAIRALDDSASPVLPSHQSKGSSGGKFGLESIRGRAYRGDETGAFVLTSLYWTKGLIDSLNAGVDMAPVVDVGRTPPEALEYVGNGMVVHPKTGATLFLKTYSGTLAMGDAIRPGGSRVKSIGTRQKTDFFAGSPSGIGSDIRGAGRTRHYGQQRYAHGDSRSGISSGFDSSPYGSSSASYEERIGDNPFEINLDGGVPPVLPYSHRGIVPRRTFREYSAAPTKSDTRFARTSRLHLDGKSLTDNRNFVHHTLVVSEIKNPIVRVLAHAFLTSKCLIEGPVQPYNRMCDKDVLVPVGIMNLRLTIENAMETWIMTEKGFKTGANIVGNNQFYVSIDGVSMMIYGSLAFYHRSLIYNSDGVVLLPYVKPRKYLAGSETVYVTSESQLALHTAHRPDIIAVAVSFEEEQWGGVIPITGYYKYPDANKKLESGQFMPGYSGYREFITRFPTQKKHLDMQVARHEQRSYRDMHRKIPPVAFQGKTIEYEFETGRRSLLITGRGHRKGKCYPGAKAVWDGKEHHFADPHIGQMRTTTA